VLLGQKLLVVGTVILILLGGESVQAVERIVLSPDGHGFVLSESNREFHPWGFNYGNEGRLMEDFWDKDWVRLEEDFRKMKELGANVVRVHLQLGKFMSGPGQPNRESFTQLSGLLRLAEVNGLYLDVTGLACYRPSDTPKWYSGTEEKQRWAVQSNFWRAVAGRCSDSKSIFCYDLMNEPLSLGEKRQPGQWGSGKLFGGYDFLQFITLDPNGRKREEIPIAWIRMLTAAIRSCDTNTLVTVGMLPWTSDWGHLSGFVPERVAPVMDFLSVHIYPDAKRPREAMEALEKCAAGKPVVIEETFPLQCNPAQEEQFLRDSRKI
jgi:Cellulase (glycosyl hydrolase family 5)